ncbi:MAG: serine--tRNA ligase [Candidatus Cloacimonetes bacterium]|nr:serine--tRNA ligase [Candidatus Cloacimonadota bacterium]
MLDIKFIRKNKELVKKCITAKNEKADIDKFLKIDKKLKELKFQFEEKRKLQNSVSKQIAEYKKNRKNADKEIEEMKKIAGEIKDINAEINKISEEFHRIYLTIPNIFDDSVPIGKSDEDNVVIKEWGKKQLSNFEPLNHIELSEKLQLIDFKRAVKIAGSGFVCYTDRGANLERALINFMLDFHQKNHGYQEIFPPFLANRKTMTGTGQLPKLEEDMYIVEQDDFFLIPTAEVPVTNFHQDEILDEDELPIKYVAYTPCFRREAGSYGKETKGLQRIHQFNKVELVQFVKPENSENALHEILRSAEAVLQALKLPYRVRLLCSGDLSFAAYKCYDIEVWAGGVGKYLEVSSCSNYIDFQARRANIRYRSKKDGKVHFVHTLNGSGVATPRTMIAILENYQNSSGEIIVPEPLRKYLGNIEIIK